MPSLTPTKTTTDPEFVGISRRTSVMEDVARRLYDAEIALHHARQTDVDAWIAAAYDRLHQAVEAYVAAAVSSA
jgi:hypothetical protein